MPGEEEEFSGAERIVPEIPTLIVCISLITGGILIRICFTGNKKRRYLLPFVFLCGFVISAGYLIRIGFAYRGGRTVYDEVREIAYKGLTEQAVSESMQNQGNASGDFRGMPDMEEAAGSQGIPDIKEAALSLRNPEYRFWLSVPGTGIDYPVVQHADNQYYLNHDFMGKERIAGSIFADCGSIPLAVDNTIVYGHNMKDGSMFAGLKKYKDEAFYREHPVIRIFYQGEWRECPVFSCQIRSENDAGAYRTNLLKDEWNDYLDEMYRASMYETDTVPDGDEKLITCSTCINRNDRLIVQALLRDKK